MEPIELKGQPGELRMTIEIKRAATGKVDRYELVGSATDEQAEQLGLKEAPHGSNAQHSK